MDTVRTSRLFISSVSIILPISRGPVASRKNDLEHLILFK